MGRVQTSRKVGRQRKINIKKNPRGRGPPVRSWAKAKRQSLQDRQAQSWRIGNLTNFSRRKRPCRELRQDPRRVSDALRPPGSLREEVHAREECATHHQPSSLKGWSACLEGLGDHLRRQLHVEGDAWPQEHNSRRADPRAQGAGGHSPGSGAPSWIGRGWEDTG